MRAGSLLLVLIALGGYACTKADPLYCDKQSDCPLGRVCDIVAAECVRDGDDGAISDDTSTGGRPDSSSDSVHGDSRCLTSDACKAPNSVCDQTRGLCVECLGDMQCMAIDKPFCMANRCEGCAKTAALTCALKDATKPICGPSGACIQCTDAAAHCRDTARAFCMSGSCVGCQGAGVGACKAPLGVCDASNGRCVECTSDSNCTTDPAKSFCAANKCESCAKATPQGCSMRNAATPVCGTNGACVECNTTADCARDATKPICTAFTCGRCTADTQCAAKGDGPGVCMDHQDGRCATDAETIYVQKGGACASGAGTSATPLCGPQDAAAALTASRRVVVIRGAVDEFSWSLAGAQVTVVGQTAGVVSGTIAVGASTGMTIAGGDIYVRNLTISCVPDISDRGVVAQSGAVLRLNRVNVKNCAKGGIFVDGASFEVRNTTVTGNGPGDVGGLFWGGVRVQAYPPTGPSRFELLTVKDNKGPGVSCSGPATGTGVLASGNSAGDISTSTCGFTSCGAPGPDCGAQ